MFVMIPGRHPLDLKTLIFDFDGTIATNGIIPSSTKDLIKQLAPHFDIHVLTADTYRTATQEVDGLPLTLHIYDSRNTAQSKLKILLSLGPRNSVCIGNGYSDIAMFQHAAFRISVLGDEGVASQLLLHTDICTKSIEDACQLLMNPNRIIACLRH